MPASPGEGDRAGATPAQALARFTRATGRQPATDRTYGPWLQTPERVTLGGRRVAFRHRAGVLTVSARTRRGTLIVR